MNWVIGDTSNIPSLQEIERKLDSKQDLLVSGINLKTFNGETILGQGQLDLHGVSLLSSEIIVTEQVGKIPSGTVYSVGTPIEKIIRDLLIGITDNGNQ